MALRGETIGTAYIRILADGTGFDKSIEREMLISTQAVEEGAEDHADAYDRAYRDQWEKNDTFVRTFEDNEKRSRGRLQALGELMGMDIRKGVEESIRNVFTAQGMDISGAQDMGERAGRLWSDGFARTGKLDVDHMHLMTRAMDDFEREFHQTSRTIVADSKKIFKDATQSIKDTEGALDGVIDTFGELSDVLHDDVNREMAILQDKIDEPGFWKRYRAGLSSGGKDTDRFGDKVNHFGDTFGRAFGKGSRNNFLNFIGSFASFPIKLLGKMVTGFQDLAQNVSETFVKGGKGISGLAAVATKAGTSLLVAGGALAFILAIMGPVSSLISGLAAAITALGSSVAFALSAGLGLFVGLVPLAAGGVLAFIIAIKKLKDLKGFDKYVKPFKDIWQDIQKNLGKGLFDGLKEGKDIFLDLFRTMKPFSERVGKALGDVVSHFAKFLKGPEFTTFLDAFKKFLPGAIRSFGKITENVIGGLGGIFAGAQPMVKDFLGWLTGVTEEFSDWANSPEGQSKIKKFFEDAGESAKKLGGLLGTIGDLIGEIFFSKEGKETGDSIIDDLKGKLEDFVAWIQENKEDGDFAKWFENGKETIDKVGEAIESFTELYDKLDTPENRKVVNDLLAAFNTALPWIIKVIGWLEKIQRFIPSIYSIVYWVGRMADKFKEAKKKIEEFVEKAKKKIDEFKEKMRRLKEDVKEKLDEIKEKFRELPGKIWAALVSAGGRIAQFVVLVRAKFDQVKDAIREKMDQAKEWIRTKVEQFPGAVASAGVKMYQAGRDLIDKFWDGLTTIGGGIGEFAGQMFNAVRAAINDALDLPLDINFDKGPIHIHATLIPAFASGVKNFSGGLALVGERGPEVVALPRGSDVFGANDPTTRFFRQTNNNTVNEAGPGGKTIDIGGITIITPTKDPVAVAQETVNQMTASAYF